MTAFANDTHQLVGQARLKGRTIFQAWLSAAASDSYSSCSYVFWLHFYSCHNYFVDNWLTTVINSNKSDLPNTHLITRSEMEVAKSLKMNLKKKQALLLSETVKENGSLSIAMPTG